jgi:hypothetical protein
MSQHLGFSPTTRLLFLSFITIATAPGCGGSMSKAGEYASQPMAAAPAPSQPPVLERSMFARDPQGQLSEERLQEILSSQLELELPARVGILPIIDATDWRGPGPLYESAPSAMAELVQGLRGTEPFTLVSEMMPIPSGALGMEALREMAVRYKLRYIIMYREKLATRTRVNPWAAGYLTGLGALFLPGDTLHVNGFVEATLFDVKTGILMFTVRRRVTGKRQTNAWHTGDKLGMLRVQAVAHAAPDLAKDVRKAVYRYAEAVAIENQRRVDQLAPKTASAGPPDQTQTRVPAEDEAAIAR